MRVFVAGATGAIGRQLVPRLVAAGHEVLGMTRSESKRGLRSELGAVPVVADALDPDLAEVVGRASPNVIVHAALVHLEEAVHGPGGRRGSCCATAGSTGRGHRWRRARRRSS